MVITLLAFASATLAGVAGFIFGRIITSAVMRRKHNQKALGMEQGSYASWLLRNGFRPFTPLARKLLSNQTIAEKTRQSVALINQRGFDTSDSALLSVILLIGLTVFLGGWFISGTIICGIALFGVLLVGSLGYLQSTQEKRQSDLREAIPDALRSMNVCFHSGLSLIQTLRQTGSELASPLGNLFKAAAQRMETGCSSHEALEVFKGKRVPAELSFVAVALDVQHSCGGSLGQVLDSARESVEGEIELRRLLAVQTAQAKLSARIVTLMPFLLVALFSLMSNDFLAPFFSSFQGMALLCVALVMQAAGVLMVRRMLKVDMG